MKKCRHKWENLPESYYDWCSVCGSIRYKVLGLTKESTMYKKPSHLEDNLSTKKKKKMIWLSDLHLNFLNSSLEVETFFKHIMDNNPDIILVGGDTGIAHNFFSYLDKLAKFKIPVYFVLGNHDFYGKSIHEVTKQITTKKFLRWLPAEGIVKLSSKTCLLGHGGFGDCRYGNWETTTVRLNDFNYIFELHGVDHQDRIRILRNLGDESAEHFKKYLPEAMRTYKKIYILTHVPPWKEATWYKGKMSDDAFLPYFTCKAVGDIIKEYAIKFPNKEIICLCGHTHGEGKAQILPNLTAYTAGTEYGFPRVGDIFNY